LASSPGADDSVAVGEQVDAAYAGDFAKACGQDMLNGEGRMQVSEGKGGSAGHCQERRGFHNPSLGRFFLHFIRLIQN